MRTDGRKPLLAVLLVLVGLVPASCGDDAKQAAAPEPERMYLTSQVIVPVGPHTLRLEAGASGSNERFEVDLRPDGKGGAEALAYAFLPTDDSGIALNRESLCLTIEIPEGIDPRRVHVRHEDTGDVTPDLIADARKWIPSLPDRECPVTPVRVTSGR